MAKKKNSSKKGASALPKLKEAPTSPKPPPAKPEKKPKAAPLMSQKESPPTKANVSKPPSKEVEASITSRPSDGGVPSKPRQDAVDGPSKPRQDAADGPSKPRQDAADGPSKPSGERSFEEPQVAGILGYWQAFWFGPVHAIRPYLVLRGVMLLLAFDVWILNLERSARYGAGGFNVAHFAWLDAIQPLPTPDLYAFLMTMTGVCALSVALGARSMLLRFFVCAFFSYAWMMSMTDSYQHHYLLSLILLSLIFFPAPSTEEVVGELSLQESAKKPEGASASGGKDPEGKEIRAWAFVLLGVAVGFVYLFTAVTKTDGNWREGNVIQHLFAGLEPMASIHKVASSWGISDVAFWNFAGVGVIVMQIIAFLGYLLIVRRVNFSPAAAGWRSSKLLRLTYVSFLALAFLLALSFHGYIEIAKRLDIGWFSYYMMGFAIIFFLPASILVWIARLAALPGLLLAQMWKSVFPKASAFSKETSKASNLSDGAVSPPFFLALVALVFLSALVGWSLFSFERSIDLPGARPIAYAILALSLGGAAFFLLRKRPEGAWFWLGRSALVFGVMWYVLTAWPIRYEMYRYWGGDLRRRGEIQRSICAYEKARIYAPIHLSIQELIQKGYLSGASPSISITEAHRRLQREAVLEQLRRRLPSLPPASTPAAFPCAPPSAAPVPAASPR